jgi:N-acetylglucosaminyl-diphospho-decaprenol L-rhamnosyltransferase
MVSIVIVNWNSGPLLRLCIQSLRRNAPGAEIVLVDNASEDDSLRSAGEAAPGCVALVNDRNLGFAAACNRGWRHSAGDPVLFLNPDIEAEEGAVSRLEAVLGGDRSLWALGGQLTDGFGEPQVGFNIRSFPTIGSAAADALLLDVLWPRNPWTRRYLMLDDSHRSFREVDQPAAACLMVKRPALEAIGGFDERFYPAWFEDVDLCRRIRDAGGRIAYEPLARFRHYGGASLARLPQEKFLEYYYTNQCRYFLKHHGPKTGRRVQRLAIAGLWLRGVLSLIHPSRGRSRIGAFRTYCAGALAIARSSGGPT